MMVNIFGKLHLKGTSKKTGKDYDFAQVHFAKPKRGVVGKAAVVKDVDPALYDIDKMIVPGDYIIEFDDDGEIISLAPASPATNNKT